MRYILFFVFIITLSCSFAQSKYWIFFQEKNVQNSRPALSAAAIESRLRQQIAIDEKDFPVNAAYLAAIQDAGIHIVNQSRWLNAVSAYLTPVQVAHIQEFTFIKNIQRVHSLMPARNESLSQIDSINVDSYRWQLEMIGTAQLHDRGYTGKGVKIAVMDNGFRRVDTLSSLRHLFSENKILASYDFVDNDKFVFAYDSLNSCRHGTWVMSILAGKITDTLEGSAPDATYILSRTEKDASETPQEEDNWVAAAEWADSLGAQIFSTSLGYTTYNDPSDSYSPSDMDGNTAIITKAADIAASRGIVVVNSAGNEGNTASWRVIGAPADGDSVIAVGAVDKNKVRASFSSMGPSADGRVKPDVMAIGSGTRLQNLNGSVGGGSGTSFSGPVIGGSMACLRQMHPNAPANDLRLALLKSCDRYATPDSLYGYGIPNLQLAAALVNSSLSNLTILPNPSDGNFLWILDNQALVSLIQWEIFDATGRKLHEERASTQNPIFSQNMSLALASGLYYLRVSDVEKKQVLNVASFVVR